MKVNKFYIDGIAITHFKYNQELQGYELYTQDAEYKTTLVKFIKSKMHDVCWYYAKNALLKNFNYLAELYGDKQGETR